MAELVLPIGLVLMPVAVLGMAITNTVLARAVNRCTDAHLSAAQTHQWQAEILREHSEILRAMAGYRLVRAADCGCQPDGGHRHGA